MAKVEKVLLSCGLSTLKIIFPVETPFSFRSKTEVWLRAPNNSPTVVSQDPIFNIFCHIITNEIEIIWVFLIIVNINNVKLQHLLNFENKINIESFYEIRIQIILYNFSLPTYFPFPWFLILLVQNNLRVWFRKQVFIY